MQLCRIIYYSIVLWLFNMFRAILSLIIRSVLTVITASGFSQSQLSHDSSRQHYMWMKPEAVNTVKILLMMSDNVARNMYSTPSSYSATTAADITTCEWNQKL